MDGSIQALRWWEYSLAGLTIVGLSFAVKVLWNRVKELEDKIQSLLLADVANAEKTAEAVESMGRSMASILSVMDRVAKILAENDEKDAARRRRR